MGSRRQKQDLHGLLEPLKAQKTSRPKALEKPSADRFLEMLSDDDLFTEIDFEETPPEEVLGISPEEELVPEENQTSELNTEVVQEESKELSSENVEPEKPVRCTRGQILLTVFEAAFGILIGLGIIFVMMNLHNPVEKRLVREFQRTIHGKVTYETCEKGRAPFTNNELTLKMMQAQTETPAQDSESGFSIQEMNVTLAPFPQVFRNITLETADMNGVFFPNLHTIEYQKAWRPAPIAPMFSDEIKNILAKQGESLESIRHLEAVKAKYLPAYQKISGKVKVINENVTKIEKKLSEFPELQEVEELTADTLKFASDQHPEILPELERLAALRKESVDLQKNWMELNQTVAKELAKMREKIALDGKAFSTILHYSVPTEQSLTEYLFQSTIQKRLQESVNWGNALAQMAEMVLLPKSGRPAKSLKADGVIELFGQEFDFDSRWESEMDSEFAVSYDGSLHIASKRVPEEMLKDAFIVAGYSEKPGMGMRKISARIPLVYDSMVLGDHAALPLYTHAQCCVLVLDLTLFGDEIRGKINMEMNQVSFESPQEGAELAGILYSQFEGKTFPKIVVSADVSGLRSAPQVKCVSSNVQEMLPNWTAALQKIHLHAREEIVSSIFERLKNEETAFNGLLEPFYEEIIACSEKTDLFRNFQQGPQHEAEVEIVPMDLAHLEVNQLDVTENIPTYNPNLGMEEPTAVQESVSGQVGSQAEPVKPIVKSVPVKKVAEIAPIVPAESGNPANPEGAKAQEEVKAQEAPKAQEEVKAPEASKAQESAEPVSVAPLTDLPDGFGKPMPNVADPVFYSNQKQPVDVPQNRKKALPLPMSKSTSNFGS
ncbi:MAG: hypothetical protein K6C40_07450 [Thermoguttaceae bacterium]|nr:hypothetical protein [Thermoguttaceae bacterium]